MDAVPTLEAWRKFVESVDKTYEESDLERYTLER